MRARGEGKGQDGEGTTFGRRGEKVHYSSPNFIHTGVTSYLQGKNSKLPLNCCWYYIWTNLHQIHSNLATNAACLDAMLGLHQTDTHIFTHTLGMCKIAKL